MSTARRWGEKNYQGNHKHSKDTEILGHSKGHFQPHKWKETSCSGNSLSLKVLYTYVHTYFQYWKYKLSITFRAQETFLPTYDYENNYNTILIMPRDLENTN